MRAPGTWGFGAWLKAAWEAVEPGARACWLWGLTALGLEHQVKQCRALLGESYCGQWTPLLWTVARVLKAGGYVRWFHSCGP